MWIEGAIISNEKDSECYVPVEDIWNRIDLKNEYISGHIIENPINSDFFERVYPSKLDKMKFVTKEILKEAYESFKK